MAALPLSGSYALVKEWSFAPTQHRNLIATTKQTVQLTESANEIYPDGSIAYPDKVGVNTLLVKNGFHLVKGDGGVAVFAGAAV